MTAESPFDAKPPRSAVIAAIVSLIAADVYFLIFAQFAFVELAKPVAGNRLALLLGFLVLGGVTGSFAAGRKFSFQRYQRSIANAFRACGAAAAVALVAHTWAVLVIAALAIGLALGWLTVTLTSGFRSVVGGARLGMWCGIGTGVAYAICNLPWLFNASPTAQTIVAAFAAVVGAVTANWLQPSQMPVSTSTDFRRLPVAIWVVALMALVWMDSAAFSIIQSTPALRAATWSEPWQLGGNALIHLLAAILAGIAFDRGWAGRSLVAAYLLLAVACAILSGQIDRVVPAVVLYTAGVSIYSTILVAYPARGGGPMIAAGVFAISGWIGSGLGIGMAQRLSFIPIGFVALAGLTVIAGMWARSRLVRQRVG